MLNKRSFSIPSFVTKLCRLSYTLSQSQEREARLKAATEALHEWEKKLMNKKAHKIQKAYRRHLKEKARKIQETHRLHSPTLEDIREEKENKRQDENAALGSKEILLNGTLVLKESNPPPNKVEKAPSAQLSQAKRVAGQILSPHFPHRENVH